MTTELIGLTGHLLAVEADASDLRFVPVDVDRVSEVCTRDCSQLLTRANPTDSIPIGEPLRSTLASGDPAR